MNMERKDKDFCGVGAHNDILGLYRCGFVRFVLTFSWKGEDANFKAKRARNVNDSRLLEGCSHVLICSASEEPDGCSSPHWPLPLLKM